MKVFFRVDASIKIGSGHVMRCLTIANELKKNGANILFITRPYEGNLNSLISTKGFKVFELPNKNKFEIDTEKAIIDNSQSPDFYEEGDAKDCIQSLINNQPDWLIVDHYDLGEKWEKKLKPYVKKIMVIDDLANRKHVCDLLLDQNWFEKMDTRYNNLLPAKCLKLLGPKFALLRREFSETRKNTDYRNNNNERVFVSSGGADPNNLTGTIIKALCVPKLSHLELDVVLGENNPNINQIKDRVVRRPFTNLHIQVDNIAEIMSRSNFSIGAGGSTIWERCCLGLASCVITIADNQLECVTDLSNINVIYYLGHQDSITTEKLAKSIIRFIHDNKKLMEYSDNSFSLVDGLGVKRVSERIMNYD